MSVNNSNPKTAPVVVLREEPSNLGRYMLLFVPALLGSVIFHVALVVLFVLFVWWQVPAQANDHEPARRVENVSADPVEDKKETFTVTDVDLSMQEPDAEIQYKAERIEIVSVPGAVDATAAVGIKDGDMSKPLVNLPAPGGFGGGQGGAVETFGPGNTNVVGMQGGYGPRGLPLDKNFGGRSGSTREYSLREGGGTDASEAAVTKGLRWLIRQQLTDGRWTLTGSPEANPTAGTALGLLPFLAAGKTHKAAKDNPYDKNIDKGLNFLKRSQNMKTGFFGGSMYSHGLATIAMCEAYGLSQDPALRRHAQLGINLIIKAQDDVGGGWGYHPEKGAHRDMSIAGWQIMALKSGQIAGLVVDKTAIDRTKRYLESSMNKDYGYGYSTGSGSTNRMTAVGLLCRQYMENWGPANPKMQDAVDRFVKTSPPHQDVYYYYYATQVMHHFGGQAWRDWNEKMREFLIKKQESNQSNANFGSWSPEGDPWGGAGGRLLVTSLNLLTLEVYYRYLPLYYRDAGYNKDDAVKKAI